MERTITAILTNSNDKKVFTSNANTLGELKAEMDAQGIDYRNMDFMEGLTHTTMMDDAAILPSNVQYKGQTTNNLVFMLSTTNKQIRSGAMDRKECYEFIKENNLKDEATKYAKSLYGMGANYTNMTTETLSKFVEKYAKKIAIPTDRKGLYEYIKKNNLSEVIKNMTGKNYTNLSTDKLAKVCHAVKITNTGCCQKCASKAEEKRVVKKATMKSPYSDSELDAIIRGLRK